MWIKATGWLDCHPHKTGSPKKRTKPGWVFVRIDEEYDFYKYQKWLIYQATYRRVLPSQWGCHVTVSSHHEFDNITTDLDQYHDRRIEFEYGTELQTDGSFWWLPVRSAAARDFRQEIGLKRQRIVGLHLTVACEQRTEDEF